MIQQKINDLLTRAKNHLSEKESDFLYSIEKQYETKNRLSHGQQQWLDSLSEKYSVTEIQEMERWTSDWSAEHRRIAINVAYYYVANPPYFSNQVSEILENPDSFVLSKKQWDKLCENKYAKKIRKEYDSEPKFFKGQCVQIRANNKVRMANYNKPVGRIANKTGFVIKVNAKPITRAAKGSRVYQVLLAGESSPIFAHESDLKNKRGVKA